MGAFIFTTQSHTPFNLHPHSQWALEAICLPSYMNSKSREKAGAVTMSLLRCTTSLLSNWSL
uniref:Uncharacterized protein n=1 Tax=Echeneis naucrates TaxID=173247 RepID=A0A665WLY8_ECHNA